MNIQRSLAVAIAGLALVAAGCDQPGTDTSQRVGSSDGSLQKSPSDYTSPSKMAGNSSDAASKSAADSTPGSSMQNTEQAPKAVDDATLTAQVKAALIADPSLKTTQISVDTKDGVVTLAGNVDSHTLSERAVQLASGTSGVREVVDNLVVQTS